LEKLLGYMAEELCSSTQPKGCMMMMAATTATSASKELQAALAKNRAESRSRLRDRIVRGMQDGDVPAGTDADALADFYSALMAGMAMQGRDGATRRSLLATVERAMALFPPVQKRKPTARRKVAQAA
jgi:hypothetical protein